MKEIYKNVVERLNNKKAELSERQEHFDVMWYNERQTGCFERNAINDLLIMQQLKSEISELEHCEMIIRIQMDEE